MTWYARDHQILEDFKAERITKLDLVVHDVLCHWAWDTGGCVEVNAAMLAKFLREKRSTMQNSLRRLEKHKLIRRFPTTGSHRPYGVLIDQYRALARTLPSQARRRRGGGAEGGSYPLSLVEKEKELELSSNGGANDGVQSERTERMAPLGLIEPGESDRRIEELYRSEGRMA